MNNALTYCVVEGALRVTTGLQILKTRRPSAETTCPAADVVVSSTSRHRPRPRPPCRHHRPVHEHLTRPDAGRTLSSAGEPSPACSATPRGHHGHLLTTSGLLIDGMSTRSLPWLLINIPTCTVITNTVQQTK